MFANVCEQETMPMAIRCCTQCKKEEKKSHESNGNSVAHIFEIQTVRLKNEMRIQEHTVHVMSGSDPTKRANEQENVCDTTGKKQDVFIRRANERKSKRRIKRWWKKKVHRRIKYHCAFTAVDVAYHIHHL